MSSLHWFDARLWRQRLQSCLPPSDHRPAKLYSFSVEEIYFQLLRQTRLEPPGDSYANLSALYQRYAQEHLSFPIKLEDLVSGGWLDCFCGRWAMVGHLRESYVESAEDIRVEAAVKFLFWLKEQVPIERSAAYLENWDAALAKIHRCCPETPNTKWFLQQNILWEDQRHIHQLSYHLDIHALHRALARLLVQAQTPEQQAQWAELAHQLQATGDIMKELPHELQKTVVSLMTDRILNGVIPTPQSENRSVLRQAMLMRGELVWELPDLDMIGINDPIERISRAERGSLADPILFAHRYVWAFLEFDIVSRYSGFIPEDRRGALLARIRDLHSLGSLAPFFLSPESCLNLLAYSQTRFAALQTLVSLHREQSALAGNSAGDCVLSWLAFALPQLGPEEGDSISQLLLYLAEYAYRGTKRTITDAQLLGGCLEQLSRSYFTNEPLLTEISNHLAAAIESSSSHVMNGRRFQLLSDWAAYLYLAIPEEQRPHASLFQNICQKLGYCLNQLLNTPCSKSAAFIPSTIFEQPHWPAVYGSLNSTNRLKLLNCVMIWYADRSCDHQQQFDARYQFQLGLGWLTALAQMPDAEDVVIRTWMDFLLYVLDEKNQLLTIEYHESAADRGELKRAIQALRHDLPGMECFLEKSDTLRTAELVLLVQYSTDKTLRNAFLQKIEKKLPTGEAGMDLYNWDKIVSYVLEKKIQPLYAACEARLSEHLEWGKRQNSKHPIFDRDFRQLSYLWLLRGDYDRVLSEGHPYVQALALLDSPARDLNKAASLWETLAKETREPGAYIRWLTTYVCKLEETPKDDFSRRQEIYQKIEAVRQWVEGRAFISWEKEDQLGYADVLTRAWEEQGLDLAYIIKQVARTLSLPEELLESRWEESREKSEPTAALPPAPSAIGKSMEEALLRFFALPLVSKSSLYFRCRSAGAPEQSDTALVLFELFRSLYHLSNYGDKLLVDKKLDEDHCTQLLREMFNLNGSEWWKLSANDQQQSGSTGKVNKSGVNSSAENDLLIKSENYTCLFVEAFASERLNRSDWKEHLEKTIGDNIQNVPMLLLIYGNSLEPLRLWEKLQSYFQTEFPEKVKSMGIHITSFIEYRNCEFYIPELYAPMEKLAQHSMTAYVSHRGSERCPLVITYVDIGKRAHTELSRDARG